MFQYFKAPSAGFLLKQLFWLFSGNFYKNISNRAHIQLSYELSIYTLLKWFSRNFLKLFRTPFNPLMPGGNRRSYILKANLQPRLPGLFKYVCPFVITSIKGLKNTIRWVLHWLLLHIHWKKFVLSILTKFWEKYLFLA